MTIFNNIVPGSYFNRKHWYGIVSLQRIENRLSIFLNKI